MERNKTQPILPAHAQLNRKSAIQPPDDSYLRDLPAKPFSVRQASSNNAKAATASKNTAWNKEDEIKPIIMRPADYDAKFNRILQSEQTHIQKNAEHSKLRDTDKYNEINRLLNKKLSLECEQEYRDEFEDSETSPPPIPAHGSNGYRKENLTDKQKFMEYSSSKKTSAQKVPGYIQEPPANARHHRYVDPIVNEPAFEQSRNKYAAVHRGVANISHSPERMVAEVEHRTTERPSRRERHREEEPRRLTPERKRDNYSRSNERNPYREPESIPYMQSMEKMIKTTGLRYKSLEDEQQQRSKAEPLPHVKLGPRNSKPYAKEEDEEVIIMAEKEHKYKRRTDYAHSSASGGNTKDRYRDAKDKFRALERSGSRFDLRAEQREERDEYKLRRRGSMEHLEPTARAYEEWSDEEAAHEMRKARSKSRERWQQNVMPKEVIRELSRELARDAPHRQIEREPLRDKSRERSMRDEKYRSSRADNYRAEHAYDMPPREGRSSREMDYERHHRDYSPELMNSRGRNSKTERHHADYRSLEKHRADPHIEYPSPTPPSSKGSAGGIPPMTNAKSMSNLNKTGYRHSYAEPVFARTGVGRVGLAAVNPY